MARVNVEQKAFTDARFGRLGLALVNSDYPEVTIDTAQCLGIGRMTKVWNECQERGSYTLTDHDLVVLLGHRDAARILIDCALGKREKRGSVRICGTEGRIEWLVKSRENGRLGATHGRKGGRPKQTPDAVNNEPPKNPEGGSPPNPLLPPAPAPTKVKVVQPLRGSRLPEPFEVTDEMRSSAAAKWPTLDVDAATEDFRNVWRGRPGKDGVRVDWKATWTNGMQSRHDAGRFQRKPSAAQRPLISERDELFGSKS